MDFKAEKLSLYAVQKRSYDSKVVFYYLECVLLYSFFKVQPPNSGGEVVNIIILNNNIEIIKRAILYDNIEVIFFWHTQSKNNVIYRIKCHSISARI